MIRWKQEADGFPDFGMTFGNPDFVAYRQGSRHEGQPGRRRRRPRARARSRLRRGGVHIVVAPVDYSENRRVLIDELSAHAV